MLFDVADRVSEKIYLKSLEFSYKHQSSIGDQIRRASLSIVLNIVEGGARSSVKEKRQFLNFCFGSLKETKYLIYFCKNIGVINNDFYSEVMKNINLLAKLIYGILYKKSNVQR